jgi:hypothetical protein
MGIKRYIADADTTVTNAYQSNLTTRGTGSNMGRADSLEVFSILGQESSGSSEISRVLLNFPTTEISNDRSNGTIPESGSVSFYLRMFNAVTPFTVPRNFTLVAAAVTGATDNSGTEINFDWQEGSGIDMENYTDVTRDGEGTNWFNMGSSSATGVVKWGVNGGSVGGAFFGKGDERAHFTQTFEDGTEDLKINITTLVEQWVNSSGNVLGSKTNRGIGVFLTASNEPFVSSIAATAASPENADGAHRSYYTKKFFARSSEFFYRRPIIEARWDSATKDYRGSYFYSSSLATADENLQTIYLYNYFRGQLRNIPDIGTGAIYVNIYSGSSGGPKGVPLLLAVDGTHVRSTAPTVITGGYVSTGVYSASFAITASSNPLPYLYDVWRHDNGTQYATGAIEPEVLSLGAQREDTSYVTNIVNLKPTYKTSETARFRVFTRDKNWYPNIYTRAYAAVEPTIIESGSFAVTRVVDEVQAIPFGTGSDLHTQMSFDISGSYFDLDVGLLEPGYSYKINFAFYNGSIGDWQIQPQEFKFRVEE